MNDEKKVPNSKNKTLKLTPHKAGIRVRFFFLIKELRYAFQKHSPKSL